MRQSPIEKRINGMLDLCYELALTEVERLARDIMRRTTYRDFYMANGGWSFRDQYGNRSDDAPCMKKLDRFICEFNRHLYLTGNPMRIADAESKLKTDW